MPFDDFDDYEEDQGNQKPRRDNYGEEFYEERPKRGRERQNPNNRGRERSPFDESDEYNEFVDQGRDNFDDSLFGETQDDFDNQQQYQQQYQQQDNQRQYQEQQQNQNFNNKGSFKGGTQPPNNSQNQNWGSDKPPKKIKSIKMVGIIASVVILVVLGIMLALGKFVLNKDNKPSTKNVTTPSSSQVIQNSEPAVNSQEPEPEPSQSENSKPIDQVEDSSKDYSGVRTNNSNTSSNKLSIKPSYDTSASDFYESTAKVVDIALYEDASIGFAQYMITMQILEGVDKSYTISYFTSATSAKKLAIGDVVDVEYQVSSQNENFIVSNVALRE